MREYVNNKYIKNTLTISVRVNKAVIDYDEWGQLKLDEELWRLMRVYNLSLSRKSENIDNIQSQLCFSYDGDVPLTDFQTIVNGLRYFIYDLNELYGVEDYEMRYDERTYIEKMFG